VALDAARAGAEPGLVVTASVQTHGKSRTERDWSSPEGGLWASIVLEPGVSSRFRGLVPLGVGVACCRALEQVGADVQLRWPNDLMVQDAKVGGILVESISEAGELSTVVAGLGINVANRPPVAQATSLKQEGIAAEPEDALDRVLDELDEVRGLLTSGDSQSICQAFMQHAWGIGREMHLDGEPCTPKEIAVDGALVVEEPDGTIEVHRSGSLRRPASAETG